MRIHAIRTGTVAVRSRQRAGRGPGPLRAAVTLLDRRWTEPLPILAWAIEHPEGLIVVDTGESARAGEPGHFPRWHPYFRLGVRMQVAPEDEIGPQLDRLGLAAADVRWVVLTHLHTDHAGGLEYFPGSEVLVGWAELARATGRLGRARGYLTEHWPAGFAPTAIDITGPPLGPMPASRPLTAAGDVMLLATPGHTPGHLSVAVDLGERLVILAGDTSYTQQAMLDGQADGVTDTPATAEATLAALRDLARSRPTVYLPSHDPESPARLAALEPVIFP